MGPNDYHRRRSLITHVNSEITRGSSVDFGQYNVGGFSRLTGLIQASSVGVNGLTFRYRFGPQSGGPWIVSSQMIVSSGNAAFSGSVLDIVNYGQFATFALTGVDSTTLYSFHLAGEPVR